ncbi:biotin/lipoyl-binding protein [Aureimonas sp. OT7]|uniref:efflux RND transporter periplasmic adaptor subunit n=1 Tax=Aureimonas sp. OT7 TaxID=2816454 RepID=UPI001FEF75CE|nr:biotin/lipoyl-binding protein [Aureimonas sp. OT7]
MRRAFLGLPVLALALSALAGCNRAEEPSAPSIRPVRAMQVVAVETPSFLLTGTIEPRVRTDLGFRVLGRITSRPVETGDTVQEGAVLATVDPTTLDLAVQSAEADLISAKAQLAEASGVAFRQSELLAARASTQASFESADRQRRTAASQVASAQARLTKAQEQRGYAELKANMTASSCPPAPMSARWSARARRS